jgi:hypothetical protein
MSTSTDLKPGEIVTGRYICSQQGWCYILVFLGLLVALRATRATNHGEGTLPAAAALKGATNLSQYWLLVTLLIELTGETRNTAQSGRFSADTTQHCMSISFASAACCPAAPAAARYGDTEDPDIATSIYKTFKKQWSQIKDHSLQVRTQGQGSTLLADTGRLYPGRSPCALL